MNHKISFAAHKDLPETFSKTLRYRVTNLLLHCNPTTGHPQPTSAVSTERDPKVAIEHQNVAETLLTGSSDRNQPGDPN